MQNSLVAHCDIALGFQSSVCLQYDTHSFGHSDLNGVLASVPFLLCALMY